MRGSDVFVLRMFKAMGLSEQTMSQIEADLRTSQQQQLQKQTEAKKEANAGK